MLPHAKFLDALEECVPPSPRLCIPVACPVAMPFLPNQGACEMVSAEAMEGVEKAEAL